MSDDAALYDDAAVSAQPAVAATADGPYLSVRDLRIATTSRRHSLTLVDGISLDLPRNGAVGIVGESGSGKTMLCRALIGTLPSHGARIAGGSLTIAGRDLTRASERAWRRVRGRLLGYVPQSSLAGLNPVLTVEAQLREAINVGHRLSSRAAHDRALELLQMVRIPRAERVLQERSHQLSGGMRQRVMIAAALALRPPALILDEPTTALDVTVQYEILSLIRALREEMSTAIVLVSHDLGVVEFLCDKVVTVYAGATMEIGSAAGARTRPRHPYTGALLASRVGMAPPGEDLKSIPGEAPSVTAWPSGCRFSPRCEFAVEACTTGSQPALRPVGGRLTACIRAEEVT